LTLGGWSADHSRQLLLIEVGGFAASQYHSLVIFEDGSKGYVHHILEEKVIVMHPGPMPWKGDALVALPPSCCPKVGKAFIGRVSGNREPLDGGAGPIAGSTWKLGFNGSPRRFRRP